MLPKPYRLPGSALAAVFKSKHIIQTPTLSLKFIQTKTKTSRLGFIVSPKTARLAVDRNRLKRQLRHAVCPLLPQLKSNHDILLFAKKSLVKQTFTSIQAVVKTALHKAKLLNEKRSS